MGPARLLQLPLPDLPDHEGLYQENYMNQKRVLSPICCLCLGIFIITAKKVPKRESCMKNGENLKTKPKQKQTQKRGKKKKGIQGMAPGAPWLWEHLQLCPPHRVFESTLFTFDSFTDVG